MFCGMLYPEGFAEDDRMNDKWLELAVRVQSIAQAGLWYGAAAQARGAFITLRGPVFYQYRYITRPA